MAEESTETIVSPTCTGSYLDTCWAHAELSTKTDRQMGKRQDLKLRAYPTMVAHVTDMQCRYLQRGCKTTTPTTGDCSNV